jgi:hypothetical protein
MDKIIHTDSMSCTNYTMSSGTTTYNVWSTPQLIETNEVGNSIELIYKQTATVTYTYDTTPVERVFKIIYSCKEGKWDKSGPIYGNIIPAQEESYEFD